QIKPDTPFYNWLEAELARRFDYTCCVSLEQFRREEKAVTQAGQVKSGQERHEKDDRRRLNDRTQYVLGWSNEQKIAALEKQAADLQQRIQQYATQLAGLQQRQRELDTQLEQLAQLSVFDNFQELDWQPLQVHIHKLEQERQQLEAESDTLRALQEQLRQLENELHTLRDALDNKNRELSKTEQKQEDPQQAANEARTQHQAATPELQAHFSE